MLRLILFFALVTAAVAIGQDTSGGVAVDVNESQVKPWGDVEITEIVLPLPDRVARIVDIPSAHTEWIFEQPSTEELQIALEVSGLAEAEISSIISNSSVIIDPAVGTRIYPSDDFIRDMPLELRLKIYRILGTNPRNRFHHRPLFMSTGNVSEWFRQSAIPRFVQSDVAQVAYPTPRKRGYFLSDISYLLRQVETSPDEQLLLGALMRQRALMVSLKLDADSDLVALSEYWTAGFKNKDIFPMMESVVQAKDIERLDVAHLLPPTPRRNLLTYPDFEEGASGRFPDWFWTCYNFFRFTPVDIYADSENLEAIITREFSLALPPFQFGDMLLIRSGDEIIHGCIHIADGVVYTKNRADIFSPWLLMKLEDVLAYQDMTGNAEITIHRKRRVPLP